MLTSIRLTRISVLLFPAILLISIAVMFVWRGKPVSAGHVEDRFENRQNEMKLAYGRLPINFEVNQGQAGREVKFIARGHGYQVFLTETEAALVLQNGQMQDQQERQPDRAAYSSGLGARQLNVLRFKTVHGTSASSTEGIDLLRTRCNYLIGNDPQQWHTGIPNYARVEYREVYPGIDLSFYGSQTRLEYDFAVAPGAD